MVEIKKIKLNEYSVFNSLLKSIESESDFMLYDHGERKTSDDAQKSFVERILTSGSEMIFLAFSENTPAGFLALIGENINKRKHARTVVMGVLSEYQRLGIGSDLLANAFDFCKEKQLLRLELSVLSENKKAIQLYEKSGFTTEGIKKNAILRKGNLEDEIIMGKLIP